MSVLPFMTRWPSQRKRVAAGLALALVVSVVAACGSGAPAASRTMHTPTQMPTATVTATVAPTPAGVYFAANGASSSTVYALDATTGNVRWSRQLATGGGYGTQIASTGDILLVVGPTGRMTALRMADGGVLWTHASTSGGRTVVANQPVADTGILFVSSSGDSLNHGYLDAYRASDGTRLWEHDEGLNSSVLLGTANGVLYANTGQVVDALRSADGTTLWQARMSGPVAAPPIVAGTVVYLNNYGKVDALGAATGAQVWQYTPPHLASPSDLTVSVGGDLVFASNSSRLNALHASDGTLAWYNEYRGLVGGSSYANGVLYLTASGILDALNPSDGSSIWSMPLSGTASWPAVLTGGTLYQSRSDAETATPAGYLYALNPTSGAVLWKYVQSGVGFTNLIVI